MKRLFAWVLISIVRRMTWKTYFHLPGYMRRWWLREHGDHVPNRWWSCRVHQILRSDDDRAFHDHPWNYMTIILNGGYTEHTPDGFKWYGPGSILFRSYQHRHRLVIPPGRECWTLFFMGRWRQTWGFFTEKGKIPWKQYLAENS
jgi:hypothetical protein